MRELRALKRLFAAGILLAMMLPAAWAQEQTITVPLNATTTGGAVSATNFATHALGLPSVNRKAQWIAGKPGSATAAVKARLGPPTPGFYPGDLSNGFNNGPTVASATMHGLYVNGTQGDWGYPANFLNDLNQSTMIHIADDYVGSSASNRYPVGNGLLLVGGLPHVIYDDTIILAAYIGALHYGSGYNHIYHVYLPPGQDVCFSAAPNQCYSPDNFKTFYFCAYHGSIDFPDIGHVLLTVEPFQNVDGCQVQAPSPNGLLIDSTADVLSHETFETITDPDGTAWWNQFSLDLFGAEIGDECQNFNFGYDFVTLNGRSYEIQPEYSNTWHGCVYSPHGVGQLK